MRQFLIFVLVAFLGRPAWATGFGGQPTNVIRQGGARTGDINVNPSWATQAALNLFVDPTGSDSNACVASGTSACLTLQGAAGKIPRGVNHPVTIDVAAGTYAGVRFDGFRINPGGYIAVNGTLVAATVSGLQTGTFESGTAGSLTTGTWATMTDAGGGWTVNALRGKFVRTLAGTGSGQIRVISSNTATVLTVPGAITAIGADTTYDIVEPGAILNAAAASFATISGTSTSSVMNFADNVSIPGSGFTVRWFKFAAATQSVNLTDVAQVNFINNWFARTNAGTNASTIRSTLSGWTDNYFDHVASGTGPTLMSPNATSVARNVFTAGTEGLPNVGGSVTLQSNLFLNQTVDAVSIGIPGVVTADGNKMDTTVTGYQNSGGTLRISTDDISNASSNAIATLEGTVGPVASCFLSGAVTGSGNATALFLRKGVKCQVAAAVTITGTVEIKLDSVNFTFAEMRAPASGLRAISNMLYTTAVFE